MDFIGGATTGGSSSGGGLGSDNGPILYSEPNRTSAIDDLRSVVLYIFIITIFLGFLLILPGVRSEKVPTFLCITTSLIVLSIILVSLFGTTWHIGQASISGPYKAFSKDRIQGELQVKIGLRSVNITLRAHKYYELHASQPIPVIFEKRMEKDGDNNNNNRPHGSLPHSSQVPRMQQDKAATPTTTIKPPPEAIFKNDGGGRSRTAAQSPIQRRPTNTRPQTSSATNRRPLDSASSLAEELLIDRSGSSDETLASDSELDADDEVFATAGSNNEDNQPSPPLSSSSDSDSESLLKKRSVTNDGSSTLTNDNGKVTSGGSTDTTSNSSSGKQKRNFSAANELHRYTLERSNVDINYNERFYWIEPDQMRQEHQHALQRGLPYPILTVVEYLGHDEGGFSWSRQYRMAGYYSYIVLWLAFCVSILMFFLHCAAPKYGIYTMQVLGCLLLFANFTYAILVPKGDHKLVIPFEGQSITLKFGLNYWLVLIGGCLSLFVGTLIVIIDKLFPNFIFTTILDVDFDSHYYKNRRRQNNGGGDQSDGPHQTNNQQIVDPRPIRPPFLEDTIVPASGMRSSSSSSSNPSRPQLSSTSSASTSSSRASGGSVVDSAEMFSVGSSTFSSLADRPISRRRTSMAKLINSSSSTSSTLSTSNEVGTAKRSSSGDIREPKVAHLNELFVGPLIRRSAQANTFLSPARQQQIILNSDSEQMEQEQEEEEVEEVQMKRGQLKRGDSSVVEMLETSDKYLQHRNQAEQQPVVSKVASRHHHYGQNDGGKSRSGGGGKSGNLKTTDHQSRRQQQQRTTHGADDGQIRL